MISIINVVWKYRICIKYMFLFFSQKFYDLYRKSLYMYVWIYFFKIFQLRFTLYASTENS